MGVAFYPVFEDENGDWPDDINGKALASAADKLDEIARRSGVPTLYDFYSMTREQAIADVLDGDPEDPTTYDPSRVPGEKWFDCNDGLRTVRALLSSSDSVGTHEHDITVADLLAFERLLVDAAMRQVRWHLVIDG